MQENESMQKIASFASYDSSKNPQAENQRLSYNPSTNKIEQKNFLEQNKDNLKKG